MTSSVAYDVGMAAIHHRAHRKLGLKGDADLAHEEEIERCVERLGNLRRNHDATSRQRENDRVVARVTAPGMISSAFGSWNASKANSFEDMTSVSSPPTTRRVAARTSGR